MTAPTLPTLPGCGRAASARLEIYSRANGQLHGSLDGTFHVCADHVQAATDTLTAAGFVPYRVRGGVGPTRCGQGFDFLTGYPLTAPTPPETDEWHPDWCEVPHRYGDRDGHVSPALQVITDMGLTAVRLEQQRAEVPPVLTISHWHARIGPEDELPMPAEPDELVFMRVPAAAELAAHIATLIALDMGGAR